MWTQGTPLTACHLDINSCKSIQHLLYNVQLVKKSFSTKGQCQNINLNPIDVSTIGYITI